ncbi:MAG: Hsp70 family protein, partial [Myxococcales bacterium]|nr:Hsp70 family protein [Myxococcales bacterium]
MARYVVGIDLGTTHCAVAYSPIGQADVRLFAVPQLVAAGEVADRPLLPSFLYLPAPGEVDPEAARLPWGEGTPVAGEWARRLGAATPNRLVASAKSWICHGG